MERLPFLPHCGKPEFRRPAPQRGTCFARACISALIASCRSQFTVTFRRRPAREKLDLRIWIAAMFSC